MTKKRKLGTIGAALAMGAASSVLLTPVEQTLTGQVVGLQFDGFKQPDQQRLELVVATDGRATRSFDITPLFRKAMREGREFGLTKDSQPIVYIVSRAINALPPDNQPVAFTYKISLLQNWLLANGYREWSVQPIDLAPTLESARAVTPKSAQAIAPAGRKMS